jgi:hypothetical protein
MPVSNPSINGSLPGPTGPTGPAGVAGLSVQGVSLHELADPNTTSDWGPIINTAFANGARTFIVPQDRAYTFSTPLNFAGAGDSTKGAPRFVGTRGYSWLYSSPNAEWGNISRLVWTGGAGSGTVNDDGTRSVINARGNDGLIFENMGVFYNNAAFNGILVDLRARGNYYLGGPDSSAPFIWSSRALFDKCQVGSLTPADMSADCLFHVNGHVNGIFRDSTFRGAQHCFRGQYNMNADNLIFENLLLTSFNQSFVINPGRYWLFRDNYPLPGGTPDFWHVNSEDIVGATAGGGMGTSLWSEFEWNNISHWDPTTFQKIMKQGINHVWNFKVRGGFTWTGNILDPALPTEFQLLGGGSVDIENFNFGRGYRAEIERAYIDLGDVDANTLSRKRKVRIVNCGMSTPNSGSDGQIIHKKGHQNVEIRGNGAGGDSSTPSVSVIDTDGYERGGPQGYTTARLQVANHAGQSCIELGSSGNYRFGFISFTSPVGGTVAGLLLDITFNHILYPAYRTFDTSNQIPHLSLTPMDAPGNLAEEAGRKLAAAGLYYRTSPNQQSSFQIGTNLALPGAVHYCIAYRMAIN